LKTVIVTGIPGVGKTTVIKELETLAKDHNVKLTTLSFGTVMKELYEKRNRVLHRDELRRLPVNAQKKMQEKVARVLAKKVRSGILLVDTHMFIRTRSGLWSGLPKPVLSILKPALLVLLEAIPEDILKRREGDPTRMRDKVTMYDVMSDLDWARASASSCAVVTGTPIKVILNESGKQKETAKELFEAIIIEEIGG
jgi:adenylate kinase